jgi:flagellar protein FliS
MYGNGANAYKQANVTTADTGRLILMCYEGAIGNLKIAKQKYASREYEAKGKAIQKVQDILDVLMQSLDFEKGGAIAGNLDALYNYMSRRLLEADVNKNEKALDEIIYLFEELESAWKEIFSASKYDHSTDPRLAQNTVEEKPGTACIAGAY